MRSFLENISVWIPWILEFLEKIPHETDEISPIVESLSPEKKGSFQKIPASSPLL
jgi:hypothetical protein